MREVTAKELAVAFEGKLVKIESPEHYGISLDMEKACIDYNEDFNELTFTAGNYNHDGIGSVSIDVSIISASGIHFFKYLIFAISPFKLQNSGNKTSIFIFVWNVPKLIYDWFYSF